MPLLNWLATELDSVLLMVEHRANHMALRVRFPRKNLAVLALPSDGAKAPRPGTPERAAQGEEALRVRDTVPSAGGLRTVRAARNCVPPSDGEGRDGVAHAAPGTDRTRRPLHENLAPPQCPPPALSRAWIE
jgi:hypothetical protein